MALMDVDQSQELDEKESGSDPRSDRQEEQESGRESGAVIEMEDDLPVAGKPLNSVLIDVYDKIVLLSSLFFVTFFILNSL